LDRELERVVNVEQDVGDGDTTLTCRQLARRQDTDATPRQIFTTSRRIVFVPYMVQ